ncbi:MAG: tripartite ATP-independent transporter DctP family solute receptor [Rhodothermales bacterium]|jgi:tripartite ATP-independent transporter DctP family solute receptor
MMQRASLPVLTLALSLLGCGPVSDVTVITLGHGLDPSHPVHQSMAFMADTLAEMSDGSMRIDIYPSQQLGTERQLVELLQIGSVGMTKVSAAAMEGFAPDYRVLGLPYVFRDEAHRFRVLEGDIGLEVLRSSEPQLIRGLTFYDAGSRSFYTKDRRVETPEDLAGLKVRTMESASQIRMVNAMGGSATPIAWGELYTALQQGVVDAAENNPPSFYLSRHYEVCKYYILDEHSAVPDVLLISTNMWGRLTAQQQAWLTTAAEASSQVQKQLWREASDEALAAVEAAGVEILRPEKSPFEEAVSEVMAEYEAEPQLGGLIRRIRAHQ